MAEIFNEGLGMKVSSIQGKKVSKLGVCFREKIKLQY